MNLLEKKLTLVGMYNALQEKIDTYWLEDLAVTAEPLKELCAKKQQIEQQIKDINKLLNIKDK